MTAAPRLLPPALRPLPSACVGTATEAAFPLPKDLRCTSPALAGGDSRHPRRMKSNGSVLHKIDYVQTLQ